MIRAIIRFSAQNRYLVIALAIVALAYSVYSMRTIPLDALPELSDTQVIVYSRWDRSPDLLEDQVTYPIITSLLGAPKVKAIRGFSDFGYSFVYVIFEDGTDPYWARSRVLEYLSKITAQLPAGVRTELGPTLAAWVGCSSTRSSIAPANTRLMSCARTRTGSCATRCRRCPAWPRWRPSVGRCGSTR